MSVPRLLQSTDRKECLTTLAVQYYNFYGDPIRRHYSREPGCHDPDCRYIHPWQPEWNGNRRPVSPSDASPARTWKSARDKSPYEYCPRSVSNYSRRSRSRERVRSRSRGWHDSPLSSRDRDTRSRSRSRGRSHSRGRSRTRSRSRPTSRFTQSSRALPSQLDKLKIASTSEIRVDPLKSASLSSPEEGQIFSSPIEPPTALTPFAPAETKGPSMLRRESTPTAPRAMRMLVDETSRSGSGLSTFTPVAPKALASVAVTRGAPDAALSKREDAQMIPVLMADAAPSPSPLFAPPPSLPGDAEAVVTAVDVCVSNTTSREADKSDNEADSVEADVPAQFEDADIIMDNESVWKARVE